MCRLRKNKSLVGLTVLIVALLASVGIVLAAAVNIDSFDTGTQSLNADSLTTTDSSSVDASGAAIGTYRDAIVNWNSGNNNVNLNIDTGVGGGSDNLALSIGSQTTGSARVVWDGDNDASTLTYTGLNNADLVDSTPDNDGFYVVVENADHLADLTFTVYDDSASDYADATISVEGNSELDRLDLFYRFADFAPHGGWLAADWSSVGAIVLDVDGTIEEDLDITLDYIETRPESDIREYGDLPSAYSAVMDAYHIPMGLTLGYNLDAEASVTGDSSALADDNTDFDDEDGATQSNPQNWLVDNFGLGYGVGTIQIRVNGCPNASCYVNGWMDMNGDGDFGDTFGPTSEHIVANESQADGIAPYNFALDLSTVTDGHYYFRFRVCEGEEDCDDPGTFSDEVVVNGEIEDYYWPVGNPTAVELADFSATPTDASIVATWETATELDNVGFNLYRSTAEAGDYVKLNDALIPTQNPGAAFGATYTWKDSDVRPGTTYYYKLEDVNTGGTSTLHGPVSAQSTTAAPTVVRVQKVVARNATVWVALGLMIALGTCVLLWRRRA